LDLLRDAVDCYDGDGEIKGFLCFRLGFGKSVHRRGTAITRHIPIRAQTPHVFVVLSLNGIPVMAATFLGEFPGVAGGAKTPFLEDGAGPDCKARTTFWTERAVRASADALARAVYGGRDAAACREGAVVAAAEVVGEAKTQS